MDARLQSPGSVEIDEGKNNGIRRVYIGKFIVFTSFRKYLIFYTVRMYCSFVYWVGRCCLLHKLTQHHLNKTQLVHQLDYKSFLWRKITFFLFRTIWSYSKLYSIKMKQTKMYIKCSIWSTLKVYLFVKHYSKSFVKRSSSSSLPSFRLPLNSSSCYPVLLSISFLHYFILCQHRVKDKEHLLGQDVSHSLHYF